MTVTDEQRNDAYRAIGRYVVVFSRLVYKMRSAMTHRLHKAPDLPQVAELAFGESSASQISNAFFAMCGLLENLGGDEEQVSRQLQKAVNAAIKRRNDIAHGDWWIDTAAPPGEIAHPSLDRPNQHAARAAGISPGFLLPNSTPRAMDS